MSAARGARSWWVHVAIAGLLAAGLGTSILVERGLRQRSTTESTEAPATPSPTGDTGDSPATDGTVPTGPRPAAPLGLTPAEGGFDGTTFVDGFDGEPASPQPWNPSDWDVTVHSRDASTFDTLETMAAEHGADCAGPPATHEISSYDDAVFRCKDHVMTSILASGYGMIYLTPPAMVDFSDGEAVISFDISTLRTSVRDWWDVWITPYDDNLQLPLDIGTDVDATGPPRRAVRVGLGVNNELGAQVYQDFQEVDFGGFPGGFVPGDWSTGYETLFAPDAARRDRVEIHLSKNHIKVGMPTYGKWWVDHDIPELDWSQGVIQLGHHSYNPEKDCNDTNNPKPPVERCTANTWHWDNLSIAPAVPFAIDRATSRSASAAGGDTVTLSTPAPADAHLRFAGIGKGVEVSFDGGPFQPAVAAATRTVTQEDHFASYWMPIPAGVTTIRFRAGDWYGGAWRVRDVSVWTR